MASPDYRARLYERYSSAMNGCASPGGAKLPFWGRVARELPDRNASILELGAGRGDLLAYLRDQGFRNLRGIDGSPEQVATAALNRIPVKLGDATSTLREAASGSIDAIVAIDLVEHLTKPEVFELFDECFRVLTPGGRLLIHTVNGDSPFFGATRHGDFTHETTFTRSSMKQVLTTVGFTRLSFSEDRPIVHGIKSGLRACVWEAARCVAVVVLAAETGALDRGRILSQNFLTVAQR